MTQQLVTILREKIQNSPQARITFAEFMEMVLYHPEAGYYSGGNVEIGSQGDFFTASSLGSDFGELLAEQLIQMQEILDISPFQIVEMGAGKGHLAKDILSYFQTNYPEKSQEIEYIIIEKSPALRQQQKEQLAKVQDLKVSWCDWEDLQDQNIQGCFLSNELIDAFPVHLITIQKGELKEIYLALDEHSELGFKEIVDEPSTPEISAYFDRLQINLQDYPDDYRTEVNLQMFDWLKTVQAKLKTGYIFTIDYGYSATKYYHPQRSEGTLKCYFQHRHHNNPYINLGQQDITAHVDFTSLQNHGETLGLQTLGLTQQGIFLMALGLGDRLTSLSQNPTDIMTIFRRRDALHQLIDPMGLGGFYVLIQAKNLTETQAQIPLNGLTHP